MTSQASIPPGSRLSPAEVLARSGSNFRIGFVCLGAERRAGMTAIYAFCRVADDAADDTPDVATGAAHLEFWRRELLAAERGEAETPVGQALAQAMVRFELPATPLLALLDGCAMDLESAAVVTEADLRLYCDRVASAVGRACLPVLGATGDDAVRFADALGQALQFTNILRDFVVDAAVGRVYAPSDWLAADGVEPAWLGGGGPESVYAVDGPMARLCERFIATAVAEFASARATLRKMPRPMQRALVPARIMGAVYAELLRRLVLRGGDIRGDCVKVPKAKKLWLAATVLSGVRV